jgi:hypothetical protein
MKKEARAKEKAILARGAWILPEERTLKKILEAAGGPEK